MPIQGSATALRRIPGPAQKLIALAALVVLIACTNGGPCVTVHSAKGDVPVSVEIAATPESRTHGLMYRRQLAADAGMLFVFPKAERQEFWMKNTPLPLDMIFIGADKKIVGIVENAKPFSTSGRGVPVPSLYVLEVNGGFSAQHGLRAGDRVEFRNVSDTTKE